MVLHALWRTSILPSPATPSTHPRQTLTSSMSLPLLWAAASPSLRSCAGGSSKVSFPQPPHPSPSSGVSTSRDARGRSDTLDRINRLLVSCRCPPLKYAQIMNALRFVLYVCLSLRHHPLSLPLRFVSVMLLTVLVLAAISYICCGDRYISEAIMHHMGR